MKIGCSTTNRIYRRIKQFNTFDVSLNVVLQLVSKDGEEEKTVAAEKAENGLLLVAESVKVSAQENGV